ncbi:MAG TPA: hypothetical protein VFP56_06085 [Candidatus Limnocylindrales bacterium]|nr:hypothetical protein [Candidatus Limnocylindrales bacterium]
MRPRLLARIVHLITFALLALLLILVAAWGLATWRDRDQTNRTTPRFDPPVWAGQYVPGACSGGFYVRDIDTIMLTIVAHCAKPGTSLRDAAGRMIGTFGPMAQLADCPAGRFCAPSDFLTLELASDRIPWGHLNTVDMGAGGYRTFDAGTDPLACGDIGVGDAVEVDGREHYRTGRVLEITSYAFESDTIFPCMIVADIPAVVGDSGGAVLVDGAPAGVISRSLGSGLGFTPLAEGLENLGLTLCTTPDCDLAPDEVVQPAE